MARGEYIGFMDNDDWIEPETYELALEAARRTGADIVQWRFVTEEKEGSRPSKECAEGEFDLAQSPEYYRGFVWERFFSASLISENKMRFSIETKLGCEDTYFTAQAYCYAKKTYFINRTLYHYDRTHISTSTKKATLDEMRGLVAVTIETCEYLQRLADRSAGKKQRQAFADIIFKQKMYAKGKALDYMEQRDCNLFRSILPELNRQMLPRFLKERTRASFIHLLYAWRLDAVADAIFWAKRQLCRLAGRG